MSEKWFNDAFVAGAPEEKKARLRSDFVDKEFPKPIRVEELEKNTFESTACEASLEAINGIRAELGLPALDISPERVHVLDEATFKSRVRSEAEGLMHYGHAYVIRRENRARFLAALTHELSHGASYTSLNIEHDAGTGEALPQVRVGIRQSGLSFLGLKDSAEKMFEGLNEGVTEYFANRVRRALVEKHAELVDADGRESLAESIQYLYPVWMVQELISLVGETHQGEREMFQNFMTGDYTFLKKLETKRPGIVKLLARVGSSPDDVAAFAEAAGMMKLSERIRRHKSDKQE